MPGAEEEDRNLFGEEDDDEDEIDDEIDDEEDDDEEADPKTLKRKSEAENDLNFPSPSTSASSHENHPKPQNPNPNPNFSAVGAAGSGPPPSSPDYKRQKTAAAAAAAMDDSRRIFQRLWTDEDEIGLLEGFLEYSSRRGRNTNHDTGPFYDQIKTRLQLDFNKNQLVEKLRRLKKKYRNVVKRMASGKDFAFKSPHDQATFELSRKIWSNAPRAFAANNDGDRNGHVNASETKVPRSRQQNRKNSDDAAAAAAVAMEDNLPESPQGPAVPVPPVSMSVPSVIEDTVRSCLSPLFKELLYCAISGPSNSAVGGVALNPLPLNFGGNSMNLSSSDAVDERWRKQQILELEVYSKRLELVQEQVKSALEELRSMGS